MRLLGLGLADDFTTLCVQSFPSTRLGKPSSVADCLSHLLERNPRYLALAVTEPRGTPESYAVGQSFSDVGATHSCLRR